MSWTKTRTSNALVSTQYREKYMEYISETNAIISGKNENLSKNESIKDKKYSVWLERSFWTYYFEHIYTS